MSQKSQSLFYAIEYTLLNVIILELKVYSGPYKFYGVLSLGNMKGKDPCSLKCMTLIQNLNVSEIRELSMSICDGFGLQQGTLTLPGT